jgi:phosphate transport system substrate-binding protein
MRSEQLRQGTLVLASVCAIVSSTAVADGQGRSGRLSGRVKVDGSSTVAPIMMAAAELFHEEQPRVRVTVGISGSGGGFKKFLEERPDLRTDISDASRPIKPAELSRAAEIGVEFIEMPIAYDGIAVVVHPSNRFCDHLTIDELKRIWEPNSKIDNWKDVRPGFPDLPLKLYGPGTDSGTFDYFVETVVGKAKSCRSDFMPSEDDNVLVQGVAGDEGGLGYFGYSYYVANKDKLNLVGISTEGGRPIKPSLQTIRDGTYTPLSRPLFVYVNAQAVQRPEVQAFLKFFFTNAKMIVEHPKVNYVALSDGLYGAIWSRLESQVTGSMYADPQNKRKGLAELYGGKDE